MNESDKVENNGCSVNRPPQHRPLDLCFGRKNILKIVLSSCNGGKIKGIKTNGQIKISFHCFKIFIVLKLLIAWNSTLS